MNANVLKAALYSRLSSDATLGALLSGTAAVYEGVAPQEADAPYVIFNPQSPGVDYQTNGGRAYTESVYLVKAVTEGGSSAAAGTIAARIDTLLEAAPLTLSGTASNLYLRRTAQVDYPEVDSGKKYRHLGGLYRIYVQG